MSASSVIVSTTSAKRRRAGEVAHDQRRHHPLPELAQRGLQPGLVGDGGRLQMAGHGVGSQRRPDPVGQPGGDRRAAGQQPLR